MNVNAQTNKIIGTVRDTSAKADIPNAVVAILSKKDSILVDFARSSSKGTFHLQKAKPGNYILLVMHASFADYTDEITVNEGENKLGIIPLTPKSKLLQEVIIKSGSTIRVKGDTTIFAADSFHLDANANVEDLLKKLPGLQVDKNGKITAMGKTVEKVLVDGEEFFGDDPGMAVKNLRKDAVKEVQVFDKKSEQAEFTGIDDGNTKRTINLKLKDDKKKGYFGKIDVAGGPAENTSPRFNNNLLFGSFKGKRKLAAILLNGNTGQDGLDWNEAEKYGMESDNVMYTEDGGVMITYGGQSADEEPNVNTQNGFITNVNTGISYYNKWNDKHSLNVSPKYNSQDYGNINTNYSNTQLENDSVLIDNSRSSSSIDRKNFKLKNTYEYKIDSNTSIKFIANTNFYDTKSLVNTFSERTGKTGNLKNSSDRVSKLESDKNYLSGDLIFKKKFKKDRRTLSVNLNWNQINAQSTTYFNSSDRDYLNGMHSPIRHFFDNDKSSTRSMIRAVYTEPLSKKYALEFAHQISLNNGFNNQQTYSDTIGNGNYNFLVDSLTNNFQQKITTHQPSVKLAYTTKKIRFNLGSGVGFTHFNLDDITYNKSYERNYTNFFPTANFNYSYKSNSNLGFNYSGNTSQPTLNQLQPLRISTDRYNQYIGNPSLKPSFSNNFSINHFSYNFMKGLWYYQNLVANFVSNPISNNRVTDLLTGKTTIQPVNVGNSSNFYFYSGIGFKLPKPNINVWLNMNAGYNKNEGIINNKTFTSKNSNYGLGMELTKNKEKKYDFSIGQRVSFNRGTTTLNSTINSILNYVATANSEVYITKTFSVNMNYEGYFRPATNLMKTALNNHMLNGGIKKTFKEKEFTIYANVRDILNQNLNIQRYFNTNQYTVVTDQRLKRYYLIGFRWDFKNKAPKKTETQTPNEEKK